MINNSKFFFNEPSAEESFLALPKQEDKSNKKIA